MSQEPPNPNVPASLEPLYATPAERDRLCGLLESARLFGDLSRAEIETLAGYTRAYRARQDSGLFIEGERAGFLCVLIDGRLGIFKDSGQGASKPIADIGPGTAIGEMSVIDGEPNSATVVVTETATVVTLTRDALRKLLDEHPRLGGRLLWKLARLLSQRLRQTSGRLADHL